ncbi:MAG: DUF5362 family protein [Pedobacter sp.]|uniref:DUF5362 family protein n=1 Tax=Pedobacter sp. TaxID=1411316 RepID=UPI00339B4EED
MDNFEEIDPVSPQEDEVEALWVSEDVRSYLYETAKWTKFLSIVGFVFAGMTAIGAFGAGAVLDTVSSVTPNSPLMKIGAAGLTIMYLLIALFIFYPSYLLFKFSAATNQAVLFADQPSLSVAMGKMKSYFKFYGIVTIIFIAFYAFAIIAVAIGGIAMAAR